MQQELNVKAAEFKAMQAQAETVSSVRSQLICTVCIFLAEFCDIGNKHLLKRSCYILVPGALN